MPRHTGIGPGRGSRAKTDPDAPLQQASSLGSLEAEILGLLWEIGRPATGMDVMEISLYKRRNGGQDPISFASIATTLRRLADKSLLRIEKGDSGTPVYTPTVEREQVAARILNNVCATLLGCSLHELLLRLLGTAQAGALSQQEHIEVTRLLEAIEETAGEG